jgi:hypothetical protein
MNNSTFYGTIKQTKAAMGGRRYTAAPAKKLGEFRVGGQVRIFVDGCYPYMRNISRITEKAIAVQHFDKMVWFPKSVLRIIPGPADCVDCQLHSWFKMNDDQLSLF